MKTNLRIPLTVLSILLLHLSYAQVTLVSANTNLSGGYVLSNGIPLLVSDSGQLYTTNGTTATVISSNVIYNSDSGSATIYKGQFYFAGENASQDVELWATDGTAGNTRLIKNISASGSSDPNNFFVFNNTLYFTADDGVHGRELWQSDGSANNATLVSDIDGAATSSIATDAVFFQSGSNVFFTATNNSITGLYKLTTSGISLVKNNFSGSISLLPGISAAAIGSKLVFTVDTSKLVIDTSGGGFNFTDSSTLQVWTTDGTTNGTQVLHTFSSNYPSLGFITPVLFKNLLYFTYSDTTTSALWTTDGTPGNTVLFKSFDVDKSGGNFFGLLSSAILNNKFYFDGYSTQAGTELWSTDGTAANTTLLKDINSGAASSQPFFIFNIGAFTNDYLNGNYSNFTYQQFYTPFNGKLYFTADDGTHGTELWSTDGTSANTSLVKDIGPNKADGLTTGGFGEAYYTSSGIYFSANDSTHGVEPWVTNGTAAGTNLVADINTNGSDDSDPTYLFLYNNQLYFNASSGGVNSNLYKINQSLSALPVSLLTFTATKQPQSVLLKWTTANEINASRFTVERSPDGSHFSEAGSVAALNTNAANNNYQFTDINALQTGASVLYYRLKTTDKDGKYSYSAVLTVQLQNGVFMFTLSPNPVRNQLTVSFSAGNATHTVLRITDANGRQLYQQAYTSSQTAVQQNINVSKFTSGLYFIQLITDKETKMLKFSKE